MTAERTETAEGLGLTTDSAQFIEPKTVYVQATQVVVSPSVARAMGLSHFVRLPSGMYETKPEPGVRC